MSAFIAGAALLTTAGTVYAADKASKGAKAQANAANNAANLQADAGAASLAEQQRQFDTLLGLGANQRFMGNQALNALGAGFGFSPAPGYGADYTPNTGVVTREQQIQRDKYYALPEAAYVSPNGLAIGKGLNVLPPGSYRQPGVEYLPPRQGGIQSSPSLPSGTGLPRQFQQLPGGSNSPGNQFLPAGTGPSSAGMFNINAGNLQTPTNNYGANPYAPQSIAPGDYSQFFASPDYQFRQQEGLNAVQNSAAAKGGLYSGDTLRNITEFGSNLAAGEYGNYFSRQRQLFAEEEGRRANDFARNQGVFADQQGLQQDQFNRLSSIAGIGTAATSQAGQAAIASGANAANTLQNTAANVGNSFIAGGNAQANGLAGQSEAITSGLGDLSGLLALYAKNRQPASQGNQIPYYLARP